MPRSLKITRVTVHRFAYDVQDMGTDYNGFNSVYLAGSTARMSGYVTTIETNEGITGEHVGGLGTGFSQVAVAAPYLIGRNPLERELIYNDLKRAFRKQDRLGMSVIDVALWDLAGKVYNAPVSELLGGWRTSVPAYASTYHGDENGGLTTPEQFADFAVRCREMGYTAFKIHGWGHGPIEREAATVLATRKAVGDGMDLMIDPACEYDTWGDTLKVGRACDEARYFWLEDPYKDGGISAFGHRKLRQFIKTPILIGEHIRGHELHVDNIVADGTDYVRADSDYDGGITGLMKIAHSAEGFGLDVEVHAPGPHHRHCMAAIRNTNYYELGLVHPKVKVTKPRVYASDYSDELEAIDGNGHVPVPQGPGLGVTIDWDWVDKHRVDKAVYG